MGLFYDPAKTGHFQSKYNLSQILINPEDGDKIH